MVSYYIMMASKPRDPCLATTSTKSEGSMTENVSGSLTASFIAGFVMHLIYFVINTFIEPCVRITELLGEREPG